MDKDLLDIVSGYDEVFIYGAGKNARRIYDIFTEKGIDIKGFVVTNMKGNPEFLFDKPVIDISSYIPSSQKIIISSITYLGKGYNEIFDKIMEKKIFNTIFLSKASLNKLLETVKVSHIARKMEKLANIFRSERYSLVSKVSCEPNHSILSYNDNGVLYHWRIQNDLFYEAQSIDDIFPAGKIVDEFKRQYGEFNYLNIKKGEERTAASVNLYMVKSHVDKKLTSGMADSWCIPIQAGAYFADKKICRVRDDIGENISFKNKNYSEGTAIYWLWKNAPKVDYIGICQYRRRLAIEEDIGGVLKNKKVDILTSSPTFLSCNVQTLFADFLPKHDVEVFLLAIKECAEEYYESAKIFFSSRFYPPCNLYVMKYDVFNKYAEIIFKITFWIDKYYDDKHIIREDRYMGFLIECFLGIFIMKHKNVYNTFCTDMIFLR